MEAEKIGEIITAKRALNQEVEDYVPTDLNPEQRPSDERFTSLWERGLALLGDDATEYGGWAEIHGTSESGVHVKLSLQFYDSRIHSHFPDPRRKIEADWYDGSTGQQVGSRAEFVNQHLATMEPDAERTLVGLTRLEESMTAAEEFLRQDDEARSRMNRFEVVEYTPAR